MKKIMNKISFAIVAMMASVPAFAVTINPNSKGLCELIDKLYSVFEILRTLAFVGAAFIIAGWAWGYITKAGEKEGFSLEDAKKKGTGLLIGFGLFFMIGLVLTFVTSTFGLDSLGCADKIKQW